MPRSKSALNLESLRDHSWYSSLSWYLILISSSVSFTCSSTSAFLFFDLAIFSGLAGGRTSDGFGSALISTWDSLGAWTSGLVYRLLDWEILSCTLCWLSRSGSINSEVIFCSSSEKGWTTSWMPASRSSSFTVSAFIISSRAAAWMEASEMGGFCFFEVVRYEGFLLGLALAIFSEEAACISFSLDLLYGCSFTSSISRV